MFVYSRNGETNLIVSLFEIETVAALLSTPASVLNKDADRWSALARSLANVFATGGTLHIIVHDDDTRECPVTGKVGFGDAPEALRDRAMTALTFYAEHADVTIRTDLIEFVP